MASHAIAAQIALHRILVAIDFSPCSDKALHHAITIARGYGAKFYLMNVVSGLGFKMAGPEASALAEEVVSRDIEKLENYLAESGALTGIEHEAVVRKNGDIWKTLESFIEENQIDLAVVGTHGRTGLRKMAFGSVAEAVFRHASCPVVTVGPYAPAIPESAKVRHILYPTDMSAETAHASSYAISLAREHDSRLTVVHVAERFDRMTTDAEERAFEEKFREYAGGEMPHNWTFRTQLGPIDQTILELAEQGRVGLIVLGLRPSRSVRHPHVWPHAYKIASESSCPVLTIRG